MNITRCARTVSNAVPQLHSILFFFFFILPRFTATHSTQIFTSKNLGLWSSPPTKASIELVTPTSQLQLPVVAYIAQIPIWYSWFLGVLGLGGIGGRGCVWREAVLLCHAYRSLSPTAPGDLPSDHKLIRKKKKKIFVRSSRDWFFFFSFSTIVFRMEDLVTFS